MASNSAHPRAVRRGNTSGLIGLWNSRSDEVEEAKTATKGGPQRRISVRESPRLEPDTLALSKMRKRSEIVRPTFSTVPEEGRFVSSVVNEDRDLRKSVHHQTRAKEELDPKRDFAPKYHGRRRGSKTTEDLDDQLKATKSLTSTLARSKSVKCNRVKFGLIPLAEEGVDGGGGGEETEKGRPAPNTQCNPMY